MLNSHYIISFSLLWNVVLVFYYGFLCLCALWHLFLVIRYHQSSQCIVMYNIVFFTIWFFNIIFYYGTHLILYLCFLHNSACYFNFLTIQSVYSNTSSIVFPCMFSRILDYKDLDLELTKPIEYISHWPKWPPLVDKVKKEDGARDLSKLLL